MTKKGGTVRELKKIYSSIKPRIKARLSEFESLWRTGADEKIFHELVFCLLTPQSNAKSCWAAVEDLREKDLLFKANERKLAENLNRTRFRNNKARYICEARGNFRRGDEITLKPCLEAFHNPIEAREWLVRSVKGYGYKEASHFLRNIGLGKDIAILDRHILKNLKLAGVIRQVPSSLSKAKYLEIEGKMRGFSRKINIPLDHLDLLLWYKEAGEVFK
jgi:N-glycosylase/DNA lyase